LITITQAPPYLTVQDAGRLYSRASGVPRGGAMDRFALEALNALLGNPVGTAGLEWALGGGVLRFDSRCVFAFGGATVSGKLAGKVVEPFTSVLADRGDELQVDAFARGRFLYVSFAGGIDVPEVLGSRSTYLAARFGGLGGRMLARGDSLALGAAPPNASRPGFGAPRELLPDYTAHTVHVTPGTHADLFDAASWRAFTEEEFTVAMASDRTGYKLTGQLLSHSHGDLASDPGCEGAVQIPTEGNPIVLMADAPTVGGYPKIAVVSETDLPIIAQLTPGEHLRFRLITVDESQQLLRQRADDLNAIRSAGAASA
jgi:antagonist of KipI